jgi:hypothetical protein
MQRPVQLVIHGHISLSNVEAHRAHQVGTNHQVELLVVRASGVEPSQRTDRCYTTVATFSK